MMCAGEGAVKQEVELAQIWDNSSLLKAKCKACLTKSSDALTKAMDKNLRIIL